MAMTRRQSRLFAIVSTVLVAVVFIGLTVHSHSRFPELTNADALTPQVLAGQEVWHDNNCTNCHTLLGEGAYFGPDLTKIAAQRGAGYLKAFLEDPSRFYSEETNRRLMPAPKLSEQEIDDLIAFLGWISRIDTQGWPPRPILVTGAAIPGTNVAVTGQPRPPAPAAPASADPVAQGQALFNATPPACFACHSIAPGVNLAGPTLAGIARTAAQLVADPAYQGQAKDAEGYIRESILAPSAHLVPGAIYASDGRSFMPDNFDRQLSREQVDQLVAYLMTLE